MTEGQPGREAAVETPPESEGAGAWERFGLNARMMWALMGREFNAYFKSTMAYIIMFFFYLVAGVVFWGMFSALNEPGMPPSEYPMLSWFQMTLFFALTVIIPAITMRLLSEEMRAGTLESLATAPVTDLQIVFAKYMAALGFYIVLLAPTILYAVILVSTAKPHAPDRGPMIVGYIGLFFLGAYFLAIGIFASACTRNQIVAFIGAFMAILVLQLIYIIRGRIANEHWREILKPFDFLENFTDFGRGVIDTRHIVYYLAMSALFLFLTVGVLGVRKWRL
ncbi:MAG: ABC transporter permease [Planctomycetota bacterium]|jgi:ABC-2 type transport system permease protein